MNMPNVRTTTDPETGRVLLVVWSGIDKAPVRPWPVTELVNANDALPSNGFDKITKRKTLHVCQRCKITVTRLGRDGLCYVCAEIAREEKQAEYQSRYYQRRKAERANPTKENNTNKED